MEKHIVQKKTKFSDYLYILYKWKKFLFINLFLIILIGTVYSFIITEKFKATCIITVAQSNSNLGGISSLISGQIGSLGTQLFGINDPTQDIVYEILNSRSILTHIINKFDLVEYYNIPDNNIDRTIKSFANDLIFEPTDNGMIEISVINEDPEIAAAIANYFVVIVDSVSIKLNSEQARNNRIFIEKRYLLNELDLMAAEDSMFKFQKKYGMFAVPQQLEASIKATAEIEANFQQQIIKMELIKTQLGEQSPLYQQMKTQLDFLEQKVNELKSSGSLSYPTNILYPFSKIPEVSLMYFRLFRDIEIQAKIMEFVLPMYEQAKVEEQKSIPTLIVIDHAVPPQLKYSPKKAFIIILFFFLGLFILLPMIFLGERIRKDTADFNPLDLKLHNLFLKIVRIYKMKI
ncbi:MAG: Wzz/FepE/Etk N-terminal domain-containing protein [Ignavibacteriaceae bacterium]